MASIATGNLNSLGASGIGLHAGSSRRVSPCRTRRISPEAGRGIEKLGHAIEYLADEFSLECMSCNEVTVRARNPRLAAIQTLKRLNREIYFSCPEIPTLGERLRSILRLKRA